MNFIDQLAKDLKKPQQEEFYKDLTKQIEIDVHDLSVDEKLEIVDFCFQKNVQSVIQKVPDVHEMNYFRLCLRKHL